MLCESSARCETSSSGGNGNSDSSSESECAINDSRNWKISAGGLFPFGRKLDVLVVNAGGTGPGIDFMFSSRCMACDV